MAEASTASTAFGPTAWSSFSSSRRTTRFDPKFKSIGDWPLADESVGTRDVASHAKMRRAEPEMLRTAFRRCHNFIHGNEGMSKDAAFWQFLYLIFCKMYDERQSSDLRRFWAGPTEQFDDRGTTRNQEANPLSLRGREEEVQGDLQRKRRNHACPTGACRSWSRSWRSTTSAAPTWTPRVLHTRRS